MPLNSTQLLNKYSESLNCCLNNNSNTIDYLFGSIGSTQTGGTNVNSTIQNLVDVCSANVSNGTVVFSSDYEIPLKFDSSACVWKTFDDSRTAVVDINNSYGVGINSLGVLTVSNTNYQCFPIAYDGASINEWKCIWPQRGQSYYQNVLAVKYDGTVWGWGCFYTQLPVSQRAFCFRCPVKLLDYAFCDVEWASSYSGAHVALTESGELYTFGCQQSGDRGYNSGTVIRGLTKLASPLDQYTWSEISGGSQNWNVLALRNNGDLWAWGGNGNGQLGDGTAITRCSPVTVVGGGNWCSIAAGYGSSGAVKTDGTMWTWGRNYAGVLGIGIFNISCYRSSPGTTVGVQGEWCKIRTIKTTTYSTFYALQLDGTLWSWGCNACAILGQGFDQGTCLSTNSPVTVAGGGTTWCNVFPGPFSVHAVKTDGTMWTWGSNYQMNMGLGCCCTSVSQNSPTQVSSYAGCWHSATKGYAMTFMFTKDRIM